jgi:hypothetical protein
MRSAPFKMNALALAVRYACRQMAADWQIAQINKRIQGQKG